MGGKARALKEISVEQLRYEKQRKALSDRKGKGQRAEGEGGAAYQRVKKRGEREEKFQCWERRGESGGDQLKGAKETQRNILFRVELGMRGVTKGGPSTKLHD